MRVLLFATSILTSIFGYIFTNSIKFGFCIADGIVTQASCINFYERIGDPIFYGGVALSLVSLVLLLVPQAFSAWKRFASWFVPLAVLLFIFYPEPDAGDLLSPYPEQVFQWVSVLYVVLSLGVIVHAKFKK